MVESCVAGVDCEVKNKGKVLIKPSTKLPLPYFSLGASCAHQV